MAGYNAATMAAGLGANVTILEANQNRINELKKDKLLNDLIKAYKSRLVIETANNSNISK